MSYKTEKKLVGDSLVFASFLPFPYGGEEHSYIYILELYWFLLYEQHVNNSEYFATAISISEK